jgi:hypothetical protein
VLLSREEFKRAVFARDHSRCVVCGAEGVDAHHILERRLFPDGGYYINNGVTLCEACHFEAECTRISPGDLRERAGIRCLVLPPHLYEDQGYDKWGNPILDNGQRLPGELFDEESVQRVLKPYIHVFTNRVKYPRTAHLPWSPGFNPKKKDIKLTQDVLATWEGLEVVVSEKMDGENTTWYKDGLHARSLDYSPHESRTRIKAMWAERSYDIPAGMRICGENVTAKHSIKYTNLRSYFLAYSVWQGMEALAWAETMEWCQLLNIATVPVLYQGRYFPGLEIEILRAMDLEKQEGFVIRPAGRFHMKEFPVRVGKYVRQDHVQSDEHWLKARIEYNLLATE